MKYVINSVTCSSRLGCIRDIERLPGLILETPLLLLYTKGGSVPHLTHDVLQKITKDQQPIQIPLSTVKHCHEAVATFKKGIAEFIGLKEYLTFCSIHDPAVVTPSGFNDRSTVSIWSRNGRMQLDPDKYMDVIEAFQPDMYQTLCDGDTNLTSSKKRIQKAVDRSIEMFDKCIQRHEKSEVLKTSAVLGVVEGGYNIEGRQKSAKHVGSSPVFGYVIDGLHNNGPDLEQIAFKDVKPVVEETVKYLPNEKFRMIHGCWNPEAVLDLVELGIDAFDSSYPYVVTERGGGLLFQNSINKVDISPSDTNKLNDIVPDERTCIVPEKFPPAEPEKKKIRVMDENCQNKSLVNGSASDKNEEFVQPSSSKKIDDKSPSTDRRYEITLLDEKYAEDFSPLSRSCSCLTCQKHTRAYIHHLLQTRELLGSVLLTIHNLHHYMNFFRSIREALKSNSLEILKRCVNKGVDVP